MILPKSVKTLWDNYQDSVDKGIKKQTSIFLLAFINKVQTLNKNEINAVVNYVTDEVRKEQVKIDFRLFEKVIYPTLLAQIKNNTPTANRKLAQFDQFLLPNQKLFQQLKTTLNYQQDYFEPAYFYKKEIQLNNKDNIAVEGFLARIAYKLNYAIHELPENGLLTSIEDFKKEIIAFKKVYVLSREKDVWVDPLNHWNFVVKTYQEYLNNQTVYNSYANYLSENNLKF